MLLSCVLADSVTLTPGFTATNTCSYSFFPVPPGPYQLSAKKICNWGGVNATDAFLVVRFFVSLMQLDTLQRLACDVDCNGMINAADAYLIILRGTGRIHEFPCGDGAFLGKSLLVVSDRQDTVFALCLGDVNGSFIPMGPDRPTKEPLTKPLLEHRDNRVLRKDKHVP